MNLGETSFGKAEKFFNKFRGQVLFSEIEGFLRQNVLHDIMLFFIYSMYVSPLITL